MTPSIMLQLPGLVARMPRGSQGRSRGYEHSPGLPMFQIPLLCHSREQIRSGEKRSYFFLLFRCDDSHTLLDRARGLVSLLFMKKMKQSGIVFPLQLSPGNFRQKMFGLQKTRPPRDPPDWENSNFSKNPKWAAPLKWEGGKKGSVSPDSHCIY